jgi:hypothetical protein
MVHLRSMPGYVPGYFLISSISISNPLRECFSDLAQYSNTPTLRVAGFEDSLSDEAHGICYQPLEVGLASEARSTTLNFSCWAEQIVQRE